MGTLYWCAEYAKVLLAYVLLMFVYPSILFHTYLKGKGRVFWFCFCVSSQIVLISTVVLLLGLFHLLNAWVCRVLFYGSLVWSISRSVHPKMAPKYFIYKVQNHTYGTKLLLLRFRQAVAGTLRKMAGFVYRMVKGNVIELAALAVLIIYGMIYFSYGPIKEHYYGFGDIYVHHSWIYGLIQGQSFSHGIYPEGMHTVVYAMHVIFGIQTYSILLFLQGVHIAVFLLSAYALVRELFPWRYSGLLVLVGFLTMKLAYYDEVFSMTRLQCALPQEFGLYTVYTIPLFLVRYLKHAGPVTHRGKQTRMFWSDDLLMFALGIAVSFCVHFYATFMAIYSCLGVAIAMCWQLFHWRRFVPVALSAILAVLITMVPMGIAAAEGIRVEGSLRWGLSVIKGIDGQGNSTDATQQPTESENENTVPEAAASESTVPEVPQEASQPVPQVSLSERVQKVIDSVKKRFTNGMRFVIGMRGNYYGISGTIMLRCCGIYWGVWLVWRMLGWVLRKKFHVRSFPMGLFDGYATMTAIFAVFILMLNAGMFGIPSFVANSRMMAVKNVFVLSILVVPVDLVGTLLATFCSAWVMQCVSVAGAAAMLAVIVSSGQYHGYLYLSITRFPVAAEVANSIIDTFPKNQFTIVSTTDEIYHINEYGFHEEYLTFLGNYKMDGYYIPTPYVFFFVEKHPLQYAHAHFLNGPEWLAQCKYQDYVSSSLCPEILMGEISDDKADNRIIIDGSKLSDGYTRLSNREAVESAAMRYIRILQSQYPNNISVYYEDENFVCYCLRQNPDRLIEFRYPSLEEGS